MADSHSFGTPRAGRTGRYYTPPTDIRAVHGVKKIEVPGLDFYTGTAEALIEAGLVTMAMLPGQPGQPLTSVCYRPGGSQRQPWRDGGMEPWHYVPGYMKVTRNFGHRDGVFEVCITVPREERGRREEAQQRREQVELAGPYYALHGRQPEWATKPARASHLHLVWSAPVEGPYA